MKRISQRGTLLATLTGVVLTGVLLTGSLSGVLLGLSGCSQGEPETPASPLVGDWRAVLASPGGDLPFTLRIVQEDATGELYAVALNGDEEAPFSSVTRNGDEVVLAIDWYDSKIVATLSGDGQQDALRMDGLWRKTVPEGASILAFWAVQGDTSRFLPAPDAAETPEGSVQPAAQDAGAQPVPSIDGSWSAVFTDAEGTEKALGEFRQEGEHVTGTFLTPTGDYRFLEGDYRAGLLRLSTFDGAHAFLFRARAQADGTLEGDFWSRDNYHATWTGRRLEREAPRHDVLPDPYELAHLAQPEPTIDFTFPDLEGRPVSLDDPRFQGKVVLVNLFGSWCPNCNDEAPLLAKWHRRYRDEGLEIVGLAFEFTGNPERDRKVVGKFAERHGIEYPLLLAGTSDKADAAKTLGFLDRVVAYPTTIFVGRDGEVRRIHSGFAGPGTGDHHTRMTRELEALVEELLAEPAPPGAETAGTDTGTDAGTEEMPDRVATG